MNIILNGCYSNSLYNHNETTQNRLHLQYNDKKVKYVYILLSVSRCCVFWFASVWLQIWICDMGHHTWHVLQSAQTDYTRLHKVVKWLDKIHSHAFLMLMIKVFLELNCSWMVNCVPMSALLLYNLNLHVAAMQHEVAWELLTFPSFVIQIKYSYPRNFGMVNIN